jgi:hypothetical protein
MCRFFPSFDAAVHLICRCNQIEENFMITRIVRLAYLCACLALLSLPASGQSAPAQSEWLKALRDGGYVIIFRHGATYQDQADTDPLNPKNVLKQRQLNDEGRALAKTIGESLHKLRIPVGQVHTSLFQRAIDTGALMGFGDVKVSADYTEGGLVVTPIENNRRTAALRKMAGTMPPAGTNVIVVIPGSPQGCCRWFLPRRSCPVCGEGTSAGAAGA